MTPQIFCFQLTNYAARLLMVVAIDAVYILTAPGTQLWGSAYLRGSYSKNDVECVCWSVQQGRSSSSVEQLAIRMPLVKWKAVRTLLCQVRRSPSFFELSTSLTRLAGQPGSVPESSCAKFLLSPSQSLTSSSICIIHAMGIGKSLETICIFLTTS